MLKKYTALSLLSSFIIVSAVACDPEHKKKCEWYLMPDPDSNSKVEEGYIPVCARNLVVNKEDCRLQAQLKYAKSVYGKKFKYSELSVEEGRYPHKVVSIKSCN